MKVTYAKWVKVEDEKPPKDPEGMDWSKVVSVRCGTITRKAYYDFFLQKWFWIKRDETIRLIFPTQWLKL
jgi:hypothetical protein